jgi:hypothetical protein
MLLCVCSTHSASSRASWIALWITNPAGLTRHGPSVTSWPSKPTITRLEAVISSYSRP